MRIPKILFAALACVSLVSWQADAQTPRQLSEADIAKVRKSVQASKARTEAQIREDNARAAELNREAIANVARMDEQARIDNVQAAQEEVELQAELAVRRTTAAAQKAQLEGAIENNLRRMQAAADTAVAQQAEQRRRAQQAQEQARADAKARKDGEAARLATQRQTEIAERYAAQRAAAEAAQRERQAAAKSALPKVVTTADSGREGSRWQPPALTIEAPKPQEPRKPPVTAPRIAQDSAPRTESAVRRSFPSAGKDLNCKTELLCRQACPREDPGAHGECVRACSARSTCSVSLQ